MIALTSLLTVPLDACRVFLGLMLLLPAFFKLREWSAFRGVVAAYRIGPAALQWPVAVAIPLLELLAGVALVLGVGTRPAASVAAGLLAVFAAAMAVNLRRGRAHIDCGCYGSALRHPLDWRLVWRNAVLVVLALVLAFRSPTAATDWLNVAPAAIVFFVLHLALTQLWALDESRRAAFARISP